MINIALCEAKKSIVVEIENMIMSICDEKNIVVSIDVFFSEKLLEKYILTGTKYDILLFDIKMTRKNRVQTAARIRRLDKNVIFIFISDIDRDLMELFRLDVFAFLKIPINVDEFGKVFFEAYQKVGENKFYFTFQFKNEEYKLPCNEIVYFESKGRKINIYMKDGGIESFNGKLSEVEKCLLGGKIPFLRIHQSYLVNYHLIKSRSKGEITLVNQLKLPISKERQKEFGIKYNLLLRGEADV